MYSCVSGEAYNSASKETKEYHLCIRNRAVNEALLQELQNWAKEYGYFLPPIPTGFLDFRGPYMGPFGRITCAPSEIVFACPIWIKIHCLRNQ
jgi:hypothetical protein